MNNKLSKLHDDYVLFSLLFFFVAVVGYSPVYLQDKSLILEIDDR